MKCDRCGTESIFRTFVIYRDGPVMIKSGWLCSDCRNGVSEIK